MLKIRRFFASQFFTWAYLLVVLGGIAVALAAMPSSWESAWNGFRVAHLGYLTGALVSVFLFFLAWVNLIGRPTSFTQQVGLGLLRVYSVAWGARYIPGKVAPLVGKVVVPINLGYSIAPLTSASLAEAGLHLVGGVALGGGIALFLGEAVIHISPATLILLLGFSALVLAGMIFALPLARSVSRFIPAKLSAALENWPRPRQIAVSSLLVLAGTFLYAVSIGQLARVMWPELGMDGFVAFLSAHFLSGALGMLVPLAPAGLGIREAGMTFLLAPVVGAPAALAVSVATRIYGLVVDLLVLTTGLLIQAIERRR